LKMPQGFVYLVAIIDVYSRYIVSWRLSTSLDTTFCLEMLHSAFNIGKPEILNTDQVAPCKRIEDSSLRWLPW